MVSPSNGQRYCQYQAETVSSKTAKLNCPCQLRMRWIDQGYDIRITNIDERVKKLRYVIWANSAVL
jgi:Zn finger protein HypA/HybF involved in hydrogenase expression